MDFPIDLSKYQKVSVDPFTQVLSHVFAVMIEAQRTP